MCEKTQKVSQARHIFNDEVSSEINKQGIRKGLNIGTIIIIQHVLFPDQNQLFQLR